MKKYLLIVLLVGVWSCEEIEPEEDDCAGVAGGDNICGCTDSTAINFNSTATFDDESCIYDTLGSHINYYFVLEYEDTGITKDENNFFHLIINRNNWQTLYRVRGIVYKNDLPIDLMKFYWESNLFWELGDTLGYYIHRDLTDDLEYVSYDTTYVTGFSGMEVPTSNVSSVSNSDGEVSNMIAPVQSMIGDTLILSWVYYDWIYGNYAGEGNISIILD